MMAREICVIANNVRQHMTQWGNAGTIEEWGALTRDYGFEERWVAEKVRQKIMSWHDQDITTTVGTNEQWERYLLDLTIEKLT